MHTPALHRSTRRGRRLVLAVPLAAALASGLSACSDPAHRSADVAPATAPASATAPAAAPSSAPSPSASKLNGTESNGLTISDGSRFVVMDGKRVDFGTAVHDLAWSPDGKKAAFVDDSGSLVVSAPDGTGRTTVAKNPGGQVWTHPTWQVYSSSETSKSRNFIYFAAETNGVVRLMQVKPTDTDGTPQPARLILGTAEQFEPMLQTGNVWPSSGGNQGQIVFANRRDGELYVQDEYLRISGYQAGKGSEPAIEPGGYDLVFVRSVDGHKHLFRQDYRLPGSAEDLTPKATTDYSAPALSPDGKTIAARTDRGIVTLPADGSAAPTLVSEYTGTPAYRG